MWRSGERECRGKKSTSSLNTRILWPPHSSHNRSCHNLIKIKRLHYLCDSCGHILVCWLSKCRTRDEGKLGRTSKSHTSFAILRLCVCACMCVLCMCEWGTSHIRALPSCIITIQVYSLLTFQPHPRRPWLKTFYKVVQLQTDVVMLPPHRLVSVIPPLDTCIKDSQRRVLHTTNNETNMLTTTSVIS